MNCNKYKFLISMYVDNEIDVINKKKLEEHLKLCPECTIILREYQEQKNNINDSMKNKVDDFFMTRLNHKIEQKIIHKKQISFRFKLVSLVACLCLVGLITFNVSKNSYNNNKKSAIYNHMYEDEAEQFFNNDVLNSYYSL
jgi:hypothetical protein